jgi:hypothetical protein
MHKSRSSHCGSAVIKSITSRFHFCLFAFVSCFVVSAQAQQWDWIRRFSGESTALKLAADAEENVYVAGTFSGTNYLGTNEFSVAETNGTFLLKLNPEGEVVWAHSLHGSIQHLVVTSNGALFITGDFVPKTRPDHVRPEPVLMARIDSGTFTWMETANESEGRGLSFAPDGNIWVIGVSNKVFFRKYSPEGETLASFDMGEQYFAPNGLVVNRNEEIFVSGMNLTSSFGTNVIGYNRFFVGSVEAPGFATWAWSPGYGSHHGPTRINDIAGTKEGNVVAVGTTDDEFGDAAFARIFSPQGETLFRFGRFAHLIGTRKGLYYGNGVAVDVHDKVHLIGMGVLHYMFNTPSDGLWFASYTNGVLSSESQISNTRYSYPWNVGHAISVTPDDTVYIAGRLTGTAIFGSNYSSGVASGFIARRSTLTPQLRIDKTWSGTTLSWPSSAFPFALQESDSTGTNWSFVTQAPERIGTRWRTILPPDDAVSYRLLRTNEAPVYYALSVGWLQKPGSAFLSHTSAVILTGGTSDFVQTFSAYVRAAGPGRRVSFDVLNSFGGQPVVPHREFEIHRYSPPTLIDYDCYCEGIATDAATFSPGQHDLLLKISDGVGVYTNALSFEVLTFEMAAAEFEEQMTALSATRKGRMAVALINKFLQTEKPTLADRRKELVTRRLKQIAEVSEEEREKIVSAAATIRNLK